MKLRKRKWSRRALVLSVCGACWLWFARTKVPSPLFHLHKPALQRALRRPADKDGNVADLSPIGTLKPRQISKTGTATCFWFWANQDGFLGDTYESGYAYCPGDAGCRRAGFEQGESPESHPAADENLGDNWYRVSRWLHH